MTTKVERNVRKPLGAVCGRCGSSYLTWHWRAGTNVCDRCTVGPHDFHHDIPLGFMWVSC